MIDLMISSMSNTNSLHFGMGHICHRYKRLFTFNLIEKFNQLTNFEEIRTFENKPKKQHILDWDK